MCRSLVSFTFTIFLLITLSSCEQSLETSETKQQLNIVVEEEAVDQKKLSAIIDNNESEELFKWEQEIKEWKVLLNWHDDCDGPRDIQEYPLNSSSYSFVALDCGGGLSANTTHHVFLLDPNTKESIRLELYEEDDPNRGGDIPEEVGGYMEIDTKTNVLSLVNRSGAGTCGTYRVYDFIEGDSLQTSKFKRNSFRARSCNINPALDNSSFESSDYKNWPIIEGLSTLER